MDERRALPARASRSRRAFVSGGTQNEIYEMRRGDFHGVICASRRRPRRADRDKGILREWRIIEALDGTDVPHTAAIARVRRTPTCSGRTFYLMGFVDGWSPMNHRRLAGAVRHRPRRPPGPGLPAGRGHRAAVARSTGRPRACRTSAGPTASTSARSTGGPRSSSASRAASCPASTRRRRGCARTSRSTSSPGSCTATTSSPTSCSSHGAPAQLAAHRRLGDGHRRRPEARPRLGGAELARRHDGRRSRDRGLRQHVRHAYYALTKASRDDRSR